MHFPFNLFYPQIDFLKSYKQKSFENDMIKNKNKTK